MTNKAKRIILVCIAGIYSLSAVIAYTLYQTGKEYFIPLRLATLRLLISIPILIMVWIFGSLLNEPKYHKIKIALKVYVIFGTFLLIGAFLFGQ